MPKKVCHLVGRPVDFLEKSIEINLERIMNKKNDDLLNVAVAHDDAPAEIVVPDCAMYTLAKVGEPAV